jgi:prephenate dehydrogenase
LSIAPVSTSAQEVSDADLVLIATPVGKTAEIMARIAPAWDRGRW